MARTVVRVSPALPDGDPAPFDGVLPDSALSSLASRDFGIYVHVPFCASRCGYCDFNTYTAEELGGGVSRSSYVSVLAREFDVARDVLGDAAPEVSTVFIGGGTPTLLSSDDLSQVVELVDDTFGLAQGAEVTTEANPETVDESYLRGLVAGGFTRLSLGMQSTARHVLSVLDRNHTPGRAVSAVDDARAAGFDHVNLDLIYGTPGESDDDFAASVKAAIDSGVDHVSAYALIIEDGTALAARMRRGNVPYPSDDVAADRYLLAEGLLSKSDLDWYEVSNWAADETAQCRHNMLYWRGENWWGFGPGAHSHVGGVRWWNVKHPSRYGELLNGGGSPGAGREVLSADQQHVENVMLRTRMREGLPLTSLRSTGRNAAERFVAEGLIDERLFAVGVVSLTLRGRLLADAVIRELVD